MAENLEDEVSTAAERAFDLKQPRSSWLCSLCNLDEYLVLAAGADHESAAQGCKQLIEHDRNAAAREAGYATALGKLHPPSCTNKNDLLIGVPASTSLDASGFSGSISRLRARARASRPDLDVLDAAVRAECAAVSSNAEKARAVNRAQPRAGCCPYFDEAKGRCCSLRVTSGSEFCSKHESTAGIASRAKPPVVADEPAGARCAFFNERRQRQCREIPVMGQVLCRAHLEIEQPCF